MKRILSVLIVIMLACMTAAGQGNSQNQADVPPAPDMAAPDPGLEPEPMPVELQGKKTDAKMMKGLENALEKVDNENAKAMILRNMERFQERYQERLLEMEDVEVEEIDEESGEMRLKAKEPVRFFGFIKGKATKRFTIDSNGTINEKAPWYRIFYKEIEGRQMQLKS